MQDTKDMTGFVNILEGNCLDILPILEPASVQCCVTSPPYWGLRDYGTATWDGGDADCGHIEPQGGPSAKQESSNGTRNIQYRGTCRDCGARRIDSQLGLEPTPAEYIANMVRVFREVWRVLKDDGTLWLNIGDSYAGSGTYQNSRPGQSINNIHASNRNGLGSVPGLKPKDLCGIPWRLAFALQQPYEHCLIKDKIDRAWLAALVDGEGCITIMEASSSHGSGFSYPTILQVRMCDLECIARAAEVTGKGCASPHQDPPSQGGTRGSYQWRTNGRNSADIIAEIYPYLLIKRKQAIVAWNHQKSREQYHAKRGSKMPLDILNRQIFCKNLIQQLNAKQSVDLPSWMEEPSIKVDPGFYLRSDVIWHKPNPMPESVTDRPTKSHEYIFLLTKQERYFYDAEAIREPNSDSTIKAFGESFSRTSHPGCAPERNDSGFGGTNCCGVNPNGRNKRTVWTVATQPYSEAHFATFPEDLIKPCIMAGSRIGDTVLDPFAGSGTVGEVCTGLGRNSVLIELNPEYIEMIKIRTNVTIGML